MEINRLIIDALAQQQVVFKKKVSKTEKIMMYLFLTMMIIFVSWAFLLLAYL